MVFGAILAGGVGTRMGIADMPKQFLMLGEKPILIHTLEKFVQCSRFEKIYVGVHADMLEYTKNLVQTYAGDSAQRISVVVGGTDRNGTIMNLITAIEHDYGESEDHVIVTHDAVRPFVSERMIVENIDAALRCGAVDTVVPSADTIVVSADGEQIADIPDRRYMYQGQTPQSFKITLLKSLYGSLTENEKMNLTDACKICVVRNYPVKLVLGDSSNMKITTPGDYEIAQAMVRCL